MSLAIPGKILSIDGDDPTTRMGRIDFGGTVKEINLAYTPQAQVGEYVIAHVGFAIHTLDETEAQRVFDYLRENGALHKVSETAETAYTSDNLYAAIKGREEIY